jgi:hypothetical protein
MDLHERQQFDLVLSLSVERWTERLEQRNAGAENALTRLRSDPEGEGIWLTQYAEAVFNDFLLNNTDGAAFVLRALPKRKIPVPHEGTVDSMLRAMALSAFSDLLRQKTDEELERQLSFQAANG